MASCTTQTILCVKVITVLFRQVYVCVQRCVCVCVPVCVYTSLLFLPLCVCVCVYAYERVYMCTYPIVCVFIWSNHRGASVFVHMHQD